MDVKILREFHCRRLKRQQWWKGVIVTIIMAIIIITELIEGLLCKATNLVVVWAWSHDNEVLYWTKGLCQDSCAPVLHPHSIPRTWGQAAQTPG